MIMKFNNYCIIGLGDISGIKDLVKKISETNPRCLEQQGVLIATFSSAFTISELKDVFEKDKRTFFVFEVGEGKSVYKIGKEDINEQLFGYLKDGFDSTIKNIFSDHEIMPDTTKTKIDGLSLEDQLQLAIDNEDYIRAAELRDEINSSEQKK